MESVSLRNAIVVVAGLLVAAASYGYLQYRELANAHARSTAAVAATVGRLSAAMSDLEGRSSATDKEALEKVRLSITQLSLVLVVPGRLDIQALDADSFAGLCRVIADADRLFPREQGASVDAQVNRLLNEQLHAMHAAVKNESASRSLVPGDRHQCALKVPAARS